HPARSCGSLPGRAGGGSSDSEVHCRGAPAPERRPTDGTTARAPGRTGMRGGTAVTDSSGSGAGAGALSVTVTVADALAFSDVAVIVAVPGTAVVPETVGPLVDDSRKTSGLLVLQSIARPVSGLPFTSHSCAVNDWI